MGHVGCVGLKGILLALKPFGEYLEASTEILEFPRTEVVGVGPSVPMTSGESGLFNELGDRARDEAPEYETDQSGRCDDEQSCFGQIESLTIKKLENVVGGAAKINRTDYLTIDGNGHGDEYSDSGSATEIVKDRFRVVANAYSGDRYHLAIQGVGNLLYVGQRLPGFGTAPDDVPLVIEQPVPDKGVDLRRSGNSG